MAAAPRGIVLLGRRLRNAVTGSSSSSASSAPAAVPTAAAAGPTPARQPRDAAAAASAASAAALDAALDALNDDIVVVPQRAGAAAAPGVSAHVFDVEEEDEPWEGDEGAALMRATAAHADARWHTTLEAAGAAASSSRLAANLAAAQGRHGGGTVGTPAPPPSTPAATRREALVTGFWGGLSPVARWALLLFGGATIVLAAVALGREGSRGAPPPLVPPHNDTVAPSAAPQLPSATPLPPDLLQRWAPEYDARVNTQLAAALGTTLAADGSVHAATTDLPSTATAADSATTTTTLLWCNMLTGVATPGSLAARLALARDGNSEVGTGTNDDGTADDDDAASWNAFRASAGWQVADRLSRRQAAQARIARVQRAVSDALARAAGGGAALESDKCAAANATSTPPLVWRRTDAAPLPASWAPYPHRLCAAAASGDQERGLGAPLRWPFIDLMPMPGLVAAGREETRDSRLHDADVRAAFLAATPEGAAAARRAAVDAATAAAAATTTDGDNLQCSDDGGDAGELGPSDVPPWAWFGVPPARTLRAAATQADSGAAMVQPWVAATVTYHITRRTAEGTSWQELAQLYRAAARSCATTARAASGARWAAGVVMAGSLADAGADLPPGPAVPPPTPAAPAPAARPSALVAWRWPSDAALAGALEPATATAGQQTAAAEAWLPQVTLRHVVLDVAVSDEAASRGSPPPQFDALVTAARADAAARHAAAPDGGPLPPHLVAAEAPALAALAAAIDAAAGEALEANVTHIPAAAYAAAVAGRVHPHVGANERYVLEVAFTSDDNGGDDRDAVASVAAHSLWGALAGLTTLGQAVRSWGVKRPAPSLADALLCRLAGGAARCGAWVGAATTDGAAVDDVAGALAGSVGVATLLAGLDGAAAEELVVAAHAAAAEAGGGDSSASTLLALTRGYHDAGIPLPVALPLVVADAPWRAWRGMSLDTARHFLPLPFILQVLDAAAAAKLNVLHWHLADAQSWPLALATFPAIPAAAAWEVPAKMYSAADVATMVRAASDRGIRVMAEVDAPAHTRGLALGAPRDALVHCDGVAGADLHAYDKYALNPAATSAHAIYAGVLSELSLLLPDGWLHIGADEVSHECWAAEASLNRWASTRLPTLYNAVTTWSATQRTYLSLLAYWLHRVTGVAAVLGRRLVAWEDSHVLLRNAEPGSSPSLPPSPTPRTAPPRDADYDPVAIGLTEYAFGRDTLIQGWKSWEHHADDAISRAAGDVWYDGNGTAQRRGVLNAAGWYLDYSVPWADMYRHWPLPESGTAASAAAGYLDADTDTALSSAQRAVGDGKNDTLCLSARGVWRGAVGLPPAVAARTPYLGGEAAVWTERMDVTNAGCRLWPRALAPAEVMWSSSLVYERVAAAAGSHRRRQLGATAATAAGIVAPTRTTACARPVAAPGEDVTSSGYDCGAMIDEVEEAAATAGTAAAAVGMPRRASITVTADGETEPTAGMGTEWARQVAEAGGMVSLLPFAAPRLLAATHALWYAHGVPASPLAVYTAYAAVPGVWQLAARRGGEGLLAALRPEQPGDSSSSHASPPGRLPLVFDDKAEVVPCNGWCPGIEQAVQRPVPLLAPRSRAPAHAQPLLATGGGRRLKFITWNIHTGGAGGYSGRYDALLWWLRTSDADVVAVIEATGWSTGAGTPRTLAAVEAQVAWEACIMRAASPTNCSEAARRLAAATAAADDGESGLHQTADFRRRAAAAGFGYAHLLWEPAGYHMALLATAPITVVVQNSDSTAFERGVLVGDVGGVRFVVVHLHAHDPVARAVEARAVAATVAAYTAAGLPVVTAGDVNSLPPSDAACHADVAAYLSRSDTPAYLRKKFMRGGAIDYCPFAALIAAPDDAAAACSTTGDSVTPVLVDAVGGGVCGVGSIPTRLVADPTADGVDMPPMRIDHVLLNAPFTDAWAGANGSDSGGGGGCIVQRTFDLTRLSDHYPVVCSWRPRQGA